MTTAIPRPWAVFADSANARIVMTAQQVADDHHWSLLSVDAERSTANVTVWLGSDGQPEMIEAEGEPIRVLELQIGDLVHVSESFLAGSPTLDAIVGGRWIWWHKQLLVSIDVPPSNQEPVDEYEVAMARLRANQGRRARCIR